jgi:hypothetical protein
MPGIENFAPERTDTSSGFAGSPELAPHAPFHFRHRSAHFVH